MTIFDSRSTVLPEPVPMPYDSDPPPDRLVPLLRRSGRDLGYLSGAFFVNVAGFVVLTVLISVGLGTLPIGVGLWVLLAGLVCAGAFAAVQRRLLSCAGRPIAPATPPSYGTGLAALRRLRNAQSWRDVLHTLVAFALSCASFPIAVSWSVGGLGGLTYAFWQRWLPADNQGLAWLLGFPGRLAEIALNTALGAVLLLTTPWVLDGLATLHAAIARGLLVDGKAELRQHVSDLTESRAAAGDAERQTLRRLERDLHDGPQQRLVRLGMDIAAAQRRVGTDPEQASRLLDEAFQQSQDALAEIRTLSRGIAPPILSEGGLGAAATALAARGSVPVEVDVDPRVDAVISDAARTTAYFVVAESLANLEKHSAATSGRVEVSSTDGVVVVRVSDNGIGGASVAKGHGLAGLTDRVAGIGGTLGVRSPIGGPTEVTAVLPTGSGSATG